MGRGRPFRFGVVFTGHADAGAWRDFARHVEGSGFSTLLVADHYANPMACGPLLMAAAASTTTLRIGSYVYNNDFRSPALLAKEAATIDVLSGGRLELGIGAGWNRAEYVAAGLHFDTPRIRADRFEEAVPLIRSLLAGETVDHRGEHYRLRRLAGTPMTVQQPVPLLLGCGGPRMTRFAARTADIVAFVPQSLPEGGLDPRAYTRDAFVDRVGRLEAAVAETDGRVDPERSILIFGIAAQARAVTDELGGLTEEEVAKSPYALVGDTAAMTDALEERRERWDLTYHVCFERDLDRMRPVVEALAGC